MHAGFFSIPDHAVLPGASHVCCRVLKPDQFDLTLRHFLPQNFVSFCLSFLWCWNISKLHFPMRTTRTIREVEQFFNSPHRSFFKQTFLCSSKYTPQPRHLQPGINHSIQASSARCVSSLHVFLIESYSFWPISVQAYRLKHSPDPPSPPGAANAHFDPSACRESNQGHKHGRLALYHYTTCAGATTEEKKTRFLGKLVRLELLAFLLWETFFNTLCALY